MDQNVLPGKWIKINNGDLHIYHKPGLGIVIGQNRDYDDKVNFSDRAICISPKGELTYQYEVDGKPVVIPLSDNAFRMLVSTCLDMIPNLLGINA